MSFSADRPQMSTVRTSENLETKRKLTDIELATLIFNSYKFSQGNQDLQRDFLKLAVSFYGPQNMDEDRGLMVSLAFMEIFMRKKEEEEPKGSDNIKEDKEDKYTLNIAAKGFHARTVNFESKVIKEITDYSEVLSGKEILTDHSLPFILCRFLSRDYHYLAPSGEGRPGPKMTDKPKDKNTARDRRYCYSRDYLFDLRKTGDAFFDDLFQRFSKVVKSEDFKNYDVTEYRDKWDLSSTCKTGADLLAEMIDNYDAFHTDTPLLLQDFLL